MVRSSKAGLGLLGSAVRRAESAVGHLDDLRFHDALLRDVDPQEKRRIPAGCNLYLRGWVITPAPYRPAHEAYALIDSDVTVPLLYGQARRDIAIEYQDAQLERVGFRAVYPLAALPPGSYGIRIAAFTRDADEYHSLDCQERFEIVPSRQLFPAKHVAPKGDIETKLDAIQTTAGVTPRHGILRVRRDENVIVRGWAVDRRQSQASGGIFGIIDGDHYIMGVHGLPRQDVAFALDMLGARRCGFTLRAPMRGLRRGRHRLEIATFDSDATSYTITSATKLLVT